MVVLEDESATNFSIYAAWLTTGDLESSEDLNDIYESVTSTPVQPESATQLNEALIDVLDEEYTRLAYCFVSRDSIRHRIFLQCCDRPDGVYLKEVLFTRRQLYSWVR
jgi:hypothetical protein